jgi:hypothetical protein
MDEHLFGSFSFVIVVHLRHSGLLQNRRKSSNAFSVAALVCFSYSFSLTNFLGFGLYTFAKLNK